MNRIINSWWYHIADGRCIGIVEIFDENTKETKYRIGLGDGISQRDDESIIAAYGDRFYPKIFNKNCYS